MKKSLYAILWAALVVAACSGKEEPADKSPVVRTVRVEASSLEIPPGGNVTLPFVVEDKEATFQEVKLLQDGGREPDEFSLREIVRGAERGVYQAVIQDAGKGKNYDLNVRLAIIQRNASNGNEYVVQSSAFRVFSEADPPGTVKTGLPVVYVDTQGSQPITSKEEYVKATLKIKGTEQLEGLDAAYCEIRGRGNTTWYWPKKPYLIKLDEKQHIFGMHKHKRWVLLANFMDRTLMRNLVSMKVASMMSNLAWTPGCQPVELVLNGKHVGSYLLIEQVRVDNHRVAITEMTPQDNVGDAVTGGYLLELDFHFDNEVQWVDKHGGCVQRGPKGGIPFGVKYPDSEDLTDPQLTYIKNYVYDTAETLYGDGFTDPENGYAKYIDVDSFIDYWIVFEVMGNHELGNPGSVYMHKDRGGKLVAGPCWDFDWGVLSFRTSRQAEYDLLNDKAIWYARLFQDPAFRAKVKARFQELLPELKKIPDYMDECEKLLTESAKLNFAMWNPAEDASMNDGHIINGDERMTFHDAIARLKDNYRTRLDVMSGKL